MISRRLEPEVMDTAEEARDYDAMDHAEVNRAFAADFLEFAWKPLQAGGLSTAGEPLRILDVGTGTARIPIELGRRVAGVRITAIDLAGEMLELAERNVAAAGLSGRVALERVDAKRLPYPAESFDAVISNSIVHHVPEPVRAFREMRRVLRGGGALFVRDLLRPPDEATLDGLVATYAGDESAHARRMFRDSLHAALSLEELRQTLAEAGLPSDWALRTSDRHWTVAGFA